LTTNQLGYRTNTKQLQNKPVFFLNKSVLNQLIKQIHFKFLNKSVLKTYQISQKANTKQLQNKSVLNLEQICFKNKPVQMSNRQNIVTVGCELN
jgi:hypothetical protein